MGHIGKALEARLVIAGPGTEVAPARENAEALRELLNVSQLEFGPEAGSLTFSVHRADGEKCERCWHWETDVGRSAEHPTICGRCGQAVATTTV